MLVFGVGLRCFLLFLFIVLVLNSGCVDLDLYLVDVCWLRLLVSGLMFCDFREFGCFHLLVLYLDVLGIRLCVLGLGVACYFG